MSAANLVAFIMALDEKTREVMRRAASSIGVAAIPLPSLKAGEDLLRNGAVCHIAVLSADAMDETDAAAIDSFLDACPAGVQLIVHNLTPYSPAALRCLNRGARDFLTNPLDDRELARAMKKAANRTGAAVAPDAIVVDNPVGGWIELTATSEMEQFHRLQSFSDALFASRLPAAIREDLKLAVEEVGRNAIEWGNHFSPDKRVRLSYCLFEDRMMIKIEDEGEGFIPNQVPDPTQNPILAMRKRAEAGKRPGGYGVFLIQKLVDRIVYNDKGNVALLTKYLDGAQADPAAKD
ncbi:MAG: ATP-binding protein [Planctomycetota bacterium]|nr:ATP-binding protein [Planctomycetota bacterium]